MPKFENEYPFTGWSRVSKKAWLRRKQLRLNMKDLKQKIPFYRFLMFLLTANMMITPMFWLFNAAFHIFTSDFWWFVLDALIVSSLWLVGTIYHWVCTRKPETTKVTVGNSNDFTAVGFVPGKHIVNVELPVENPIENPNTAMMSIPVEAILCGGFEKVAETVAPQKGPIIFAACYAVKGRPLQSGVLKGKKYQIDRDPKPYLKGDIHNYRFIDWGQIAADLFGRVVKDSTKIIVALDPLDAVTYQPPAVQPGIYHELYAAKQRNQQLEIEREDAYKEDRRAEKAKGKKQEIVVNYGSGETGR